MPGGVLPRESVPRQSGLLPRAAQLRGRPSQLLLGVFDGHGGNGEHCAQIAASIFPKKLAARRADRSFASHGDRDAVVPHREWDADESLQSYSRSRDASDTIVAELGDGAKSSGTTAVVAHVIGDMLHMANVGDSRAILGVETRGSRGGFAVGRRGGDARPDLFPKRRARAHAQGRDQTRDVRHPRDAFGRDPLERRLRPGVHRGGGRPPSRLQKRSLLPRVRVHPLPRRHHRQTTRGVRDTRAPVLSTGPVLSMPRGRLGRRVRVHVQRGGTRRRATTRGRPGARERRDRSASRTKTGRTKTPEATT